MKDRGGGKEKEIKYKKEQNKKTDDDDDEELTYLCSQRVRRGLVGGKEGTGEL